MNIRHHITEESLTSAVFMAVALGFIAGMIFAGALIGSLMLLFR